MVTTEGCVVGRSKLYVDGKLLVDDDGLHGPAEKCAATTLSEGNHLVYVEGFQAGGGVQMSIKYSGPDTNGNKVLMKSGQSSKGKSGGRYFESCDPSAGFSASAFTVCVFKSSKGLSTTPSVAGAGQGDSPLKYVGKGTASVVDMNSADDFRKAVSGTPNENFVWAIYGELVVSSGGSYNLCISSDDG